MLELLPRKVKPQMLATMNDGMGRTPLLYACMAGDASCCEQLIGEPMNSNVEAEDRGGLRPLHFAAVTDCGAVVRALITAGAEVSERQQLPPTAANPKCLPTLSCGPRCMLLQVNAQDKQGRTPLISAVMEGAIESASALLGANADASLADKSGASAADWAEMLEHEDIVELLRKQ